MAVQFILFNFANHSPSIAMELKVSKEITGKWQNQRSETNKYVSWALFLKLQAAGIIFEKLLGWTVFKNPNFIVRTLTNNENIKAMEILK